MEFNENNFSRPVVSAIVERMHHGQKQILVMTRWKPDRDPVYSGTLEIPAGHVDAYENIYEALKREVLEETGLKVLKFTPDTKTKTHSPRGDDGAFAFVPFCCQQQLKNGRPWIGFVFLCEVEDREPVPQKGETKDVMWMGYEVLKKLVEDKPEKIFTLQLGALDFYFHSTIGSIKGGA